MKRITFLTGFYGSGKTELALNFAIRKCPDYLVDLDIINPYFRSREAKEILNCRTEIISSDLEDDKYTDLPFLSKKVFLPVLSDKSAIYDLGGNDIGAKVMRQFELDDYDLLLVINVYRVETNNEKKIIKLIEDIEEMSGYKVTGLINNSNLLEDTTYQHVLHGEDIIEHVAQQTRIPLLYTVVKEEIYDKNIEVIGETIKIKTYLRKSWY